MGVLGLAVQNFGKNRIADLSTINENAKEPLVLVLPFNGKSEGIRRTSEYEDAKNSFTPNGWIRVYCGPERKSITTAIDSSRMVHCHISTTAQQVTKSLGLPDAYALWIQYGGSVARRLDEAEQPFLIQEEFYKTLGYTNSLRRCRLEIDPEMKYILRFHIGPAKVARQEVTSKRSGYVDILKGLVFPQWKKRWIAIIGKHLFLFSESPYMNPECYDIQGAEVSEQTPYCDRLILKILPKVRVFHGTRINVDGNFLLMRDKNSESNCSLEMSGSTTDDVAAASSSLYNSSSSINYTSCSGRGLEREKSLYIGFEESWERDLWINWLSEASSTSESTDSRHLDICNSGLQTIPEIILNESTEDVQELSAGQNQLQEIGLKALTRFPRLQILRLPGNEFKKFPEPLLEISGLKILELASNSIRKIPDEIFQLELLEELQLQRNDIEELPEELRLLRNLKSLQLSQNKITNFPSFFLRTRNMVGMCSHSQRNETATILNNLHESRKNFHPPIEKINLRENKLTGNIILGDYQKLTQLDVSENSIDSIDLTSLCQLETLQCSRNKLTELSIHGATLTSLIAGNNELRSLSASAVPRNLRHLDIGFNKLQALPQWVAGCEQLQTLFANNNCIKSLPEQFFSNEFRVLHTLQLGFNQLTKLPMISNTKLALRELFLQCNQINELPENFFNACENLVLLNISNNALSTLPIVPDRCEPQLEKLYATKNCLHDRVLDTLANLPRIRHFYGAYNQLTTFPEECIQSWPDLEELVLSGNRLKYLPENLCALKFLRVLRVHSNQLQSAPDLAQTTTLRVLDLAHNELDKINLVAVIPKRLQFLDLSCNLQLQVDANQLKVCQSKRPISLIDVSGKNRSSLPTSPEQYNENVNFEPPWKVGFSETAGSSLKLYITQIRLANFCNTEGLFGLFDGELNATVPSLLAKTVPRILLEERTIKETADQYMKYTILSAHRELKQRGQKHGVFGTLCHISREPYKTEYEGNSVQGRRYVLRVASVGEVAAYLLRKSGNVKLNPGNPQRQIGNSANFPLSIPDPEVSEVTLGDKDDYLVIGNKKLWEIMDVDMVSAEVRNEENVILAAKRIQDIAQSLGAEENLSIIILKFKNLGTDVDRLIRELRQSVQKKSSNSIVSGFCKCGCCCESNNSCCHSAGSNQFIRQYSGRSDRSSPSGQSDKTAGESIFEKSKGDGASSVTSRRSSYYGGVARAIRAKIEEERDREKDAETDSALSEEQFKCWEYMLEQNTQLLFDKELNTISKAFTKKQNANKSISNLNIADALNPTRNLSNKSLSVSSPQLIHPDHHNLHLFGSTRNFHPVAPPGLFKSMRSGRIQPIGGGPNAAYFGSLQRLMPYKMDYDFATMRDRIDFQEDSLEHETRMRQYWGVATTEL